MISRSGDELSHPVIPTPVFDVDDLSFFRFFGLGLRHVGLRQGLKEVVSGSDRGDAVSLACYGCEPEDLDKEGFSLSPALCSSFQEKIEEFILDSYQYFHETSNHYKDAVFMLMIRGKRARYAYDFSSYPLGKCGTQEFTPDQVMAWVSTENYVNEDIYHATCNTLVDLKAIVRQLKLQKMKELYQNFSHDPQMQGVIEELIGCYQENIFLEKPFFLTVAEGLESRDLNFWIQQIIKNKKTETNSVKVLCDPDDLASRRAKIFRKLFHGIQPKDVNAMVLGLWLPLINKHYKKGENSIKVLYQPDDIASMDAQTLSNKLIHYIRFQNHEKVRQCISYLSLTGFNPENAHNIENPLQVAAVGKSTEILASVYEFDPNQYEVLLSGGISPTPIFLAARCGRLDNIKYFLSMRALVNRDIMSTCDETAKHIFLELAESPYSSSYEIMKLLESQGVSYGFDSMSNKYENPLSVASRVWGKQELNKKKFNMLLPHADAWAKYTAILSCTRELYYCYGRGPRKEFYYEDPRISILFENRNSILASLSLEECEEICSIINSDQVICDLAEEILLDDLLNFEIKINPAALVRKNIQRCFGIPEKKETHAVSLANMNGTLFSQPPVEQGQQKSIAPGCSLF